jgi:hypothetical protein
MSFMSIAKPLMVKTQAKLESRTTLIHAPSTTPEIVAPSLYSQTHSEGRIGYRE